MLGDEAFWTIDTYLAASVADAAWVQVWQNSAGKRSQYPKPIPRPGDKSNDMTIGSVRTFDEIDEMRKTIRRG